MCVCVCVHRRCNNRIREKRTLSLLRRRWVNGRAVELIFNSIVSRSHVLLATISLISSRNVGGSGAESAFFSRVCMKRHLVKVHKDLRLSAKYIGMRNGARFSKILSHMFQRLICRSSRNYAGDENPGEFSSTFCDGDRRDFQENLAPASHRESQAGRAGMKPSISPDSNYERERPFVAAISTAERESLIDFSAISSDRAISDEIRRVERTGDTCSLLDTTEDMQMFSRALS